MRTSERVREEENLLGIKPASLLQAVLDDVGVGLVIIDQNGHVTLANHAMIEMFGGDPTGQDFVKLRQVYKVLDAQGRDIPIDQAPIMRALRGEQVDPHDACIVLPDGRRRWLHSASYRFAVLGLTGLFVIVADETKEVELRRASEFLQRLEAVGRLTRGLLHDFNNMLSVSSGGVALALEDGSVSETTQGHLQQAALALQKGASLARRLAQFSRVEKMDVRPVQLNATVAAALELARPLVDKRIRVRLDLQHDLPFVEADAAEMEQVIVNLILNALDAMPDGGELTLHTEVAAGNPLIRDKPGEAVEFVLITVTDTGSGIPENLQSRIFEPFFTTKPDGRGTGLGLSSAYGIVHQHGGEIKFQSAPGAGSTFSIYLPLQASSGPSCEEAA